MIWSHEGETKCVVSSGSEIDEPRRFEYDVEAEPSNVEVPTFDAFVLHDYRVQILDIHVGSSPRSVVGPTNIYPELGSPLNRTGYSGVEGEKRAGTPERGQALR